MNVEIICPLYNAEDYLINLDKSIKMQKNVEIAKINYILTRSSDKTEDILKEIGVKDYTVVEPKDFSHGLTRETAAMKSEADVLVFITQDVDIRNDDWLEKLVTPIFNGEVDAAFSRQLTKFDTIEKYTREKNYPSESYIVSEDDIKTMGLQTFFFSDAAGAVKTETFKKLNGYDGKRLQMSEDMYIAHKLITNGYKIKYCADSIVYHSHKYTLKQLYKRYYATGVFFKENSHIDKYGTTKTGGSLAGFILKRALQDKNWKVLLRFLPDMAVRYLGLKMGKIIG